jgi:hypothetical protein
MTTFLLIHGMWHGGWCWERLTPLLRDAGHNVHAPTLAGLAERANMRSDAIDLNTHIQDVIDLIESQNVRGNSRAVALCCARRFFTRSSCGMGEKYPRAAIAARGCGWDGGYYCAGVLCTATPTQVKSLFSLAAPAGL